MFGWIALGSVGLEKVVVEKVSLKTLEHGFAYQWTSIATRAVKSLGFFYFIDSQLFSPQIVSG